MVDLENFDAEDLMEKAQTKFNENQNYIYGALVIIALVIGGVWWFTKSSEEKNIAANEAIWKSEFAFAKDSFNLAINGGVDANGYPQQGLSDVAKEYSGTDAGELAKYRMGIGYLNMGQYDAAIEHLEDVSFNDDMVGAIAKGALGDAYYEKGEVGKAISNYKDAVNHSNNTFTCPIYLKKLAYAQEDAGDKEKALESYQRIKDEFPNSSQAQDVDKHITRLSI